MLGLGKELVPTLVDASEIWDKRTIWDVWNKGRQDQSQLVGLDVWKKRVAGTPLIIECHDVPCQPTFPSCLQVIAHILGVFNLQFSLFSGQRVGLSFKMHWKWRCFLSFCWPFSGNSPPRVTEPCEWLHSSILVTWRATELPRWNNVEGNLWIQLSLKKLKLV